MLTAVAVGLVAAIAVVWVFNRLISLGVRASNAWSDIDVQLKRRADLIPPLVETVRGYAAHESRTLEAAVQARSGAQRARGVAERSRRESDVSHEVHQLIALAEAYPDLKADQVFLSLHRQLVEIEDHLQSARRYYNAVVRDYNTLIHQFPHVIIAAAFRFKPREFFEIDEAHIAPPVVDVGASRA